MYNCTEDSTKAEQTNLQSGLQLKQQMHGMLIKNKGTFADLEERK
jgi:hypothetical protein